MLKGIGFFIGSLTDETFPAPQELVGNDPRLTRVADYLDQGLVYERYRGFSWCRFGCQAGAAMGAADLTDGAWVWPSGLSHYLRIHNVCLPEVFVTHALSGWKPVMPTIRAVDSAYDYLVWAEWSRSLRNPALRERLAEARKTAAASQADQLIAHAEKVTREQGEGTKPCMFTGCNRLALKSVVFCGEHLAARTPELFATQGHQLFKAALLE